MKTNYSRHFAHWIVLLTLASVPTASAIYNPTAGRWFSRDPIEEADGVELYGFVRNSAVQAVDPNGLLVIPFLPFVALGCSRCCCCIEDFAMIGPYKLSSDFTPPWITMGHGFRFEGRFAHIVAPPRTSGRNTRCTVTWRERTDADTRPNVPLNSWFDVLALKRKPDGTVSIPTWIDWNTYQAFDPTKCPSSFSFSLSDHPKFTWMENEQPNVEFHTDLEFTFSSSKGCPCATKSIKIVLRQHLRVVGGAADWPEDDMEVLEFTYE